MHPPDLCDLSAVPRRFQQPQAHFHSCQVSKRYVSDQNELATKHVNEQNDLWAPNIDRSHLHASFTSTCTSVLLPPLSLAFQLPGHPPYGWVQLSIDILTLLCSVRSTLEFRHIPVRSRGFSGRLTSHFCSSSCSVLLHFVFTGPTTRNLREVSLERVTGFMP